jgi:acyl-CoA reductase-like NAD-dependent aldehyde dehydrogenase
VLENQETIARVSVRDSGKTVVDAMIGEVLTTCEKFQWTINNGEKYLKDEARDVGALMMMKKVHVEYRPLGVIGAIVPWNYPFHNVFNPVIATLMTGNAIVIKVSEYASWSIDYYGRIINACLEAAGAPPNLVQFVVGYGDTGNSLVTSALDKVIFVGSPGVGVHVMRAAAANLTPVVLELGGKDPFVVCEDADIDGIVQTACRGVWQNMGQNCAGPERFFVYESVFDEFCDKVSRVVSVMTQGPPLHGEAVDCGAICMGLKQMKHYQNLVDDAVKKGAKILNGGFIPKSGDKLATGSFYPPTVLADVPENALIAQEEIFGPIMCIFKVKGDSDDEAVRLANNCDFALSSCAFAKSADRAKKVASRLDAGMSAVNDLEGCTYMSQSLPFGGCKKSGFGRFAGPEGLRGLCHVRSVCEDRFPMIRNSIPPPLQYPSKGHGPAFAQGLIHMTYNPSPLAKIGGIVTIIKAALNTFINPKKDN